MDFRSAIRPLVHFCRFVGLAPYAILSERGTTEYLNSRWAVAYSLLTSLGSLGVMAAIRAPRPDVGTGPERPAIIDVAETLCMACIFLSTIYSQLMCLVNRDGVLLVVARMSGMARELELGPNETRKYRRFLSAELFAVISAVFCQFFVRSMHTGYSLKLALVYLVNFITILSSFVPDLQFGNMALMCGQLFKALRLKLIDASPDRNHLWTGRLVAVDGPPRKTRRSFDALRLHSCLYDVTTMTDSMFAGQKLLGMSMIFLNSLIMLYMFSFYSGGEVKNYAMIGTMIIGLMTYLMRMFFLVGSSVYALNQSEELARTVSRLHCNAKNLRFRDEMHALSLQILHHKVQFSACGLFPIDATLVTSIVGCVATYLVIVIQMATPTKGAQG